jgi:hypothetical protein
VEGIYLIAGLKLRLSYHFERYLKDNIEKYQITSDAFDYEIKVTLTEDIAFPPYPTLTHKNPYVCYHQNQRYIYSKNHEGHIQSMMVHDLDYQKTEIFINPKLVKDPAETEYVLISVVFLEIAQRNKYLPIHASAILYQDEVILISAPSQTGKSTHARFWKEAYPEVLFLNDDKPLIKYENNMFYVYGSPFSGKTSVNQNIKKKLKSIVFIEQGKIDQVEFMSVKEKIEELMRNILRPEDSKLWDQVTHELTKLIDEIPIYKLKATKSISAVHKIHQVLYPEATHES